jgi:hypothetical protein
MNKKLINKYWKEFCHWKDDGSLLCQTEHLGTWHEVTDEKWDFVCDITFIINDEYVEFRKALVEGKTVQYKGLSTQNWCTIQHELGHDFGNLHISNYRIKPEEPKFKVGDLVNVDNGFIGILTNIDKSSIKPYIVVVGDSTLHYRSIISLWKPQEGEWCWFWDEHYTTAILGKFTEKTNKGYFEHNSNSFEYCEPFIGTLPTHLKE